MKKLFFLFLLALLPAQAQSFLALNLNQTTVVGGAVVGGTVAISSPAPAGGVAVTLWSGDDVRVPPEVIIPPGQTYVGFSVATNATSSPLYVRIQASTSTARQQTFLQVMPTAQAPAASNSSSSNLQLYKQYPTVGPVYGMGVPYYYPYGYNYGYPYPLTEPWAVPTHFDSDGYPMMQHNGGRR